MLTYDLASYPGPSHAKIEREKKGLVSTVRACANYVDVNIIIKL